MIKTIQYSPSESRLRLVAGIPTKWMWQSWGKLHYNHYYPIMLNLLLLAVIDNAVLRDS